MEGFLPHNTADDDAGESLHQLLDACKSRLFTRGVDIAFPVLRHRPMSPPGGDEDAERCSPYATSSSSSTSSASPGIRSASSRSEDNRVWIDNDSAFCTFKSPFWAEELSRLEQTEQNMMPLLLDYLIREQEEAEKEEGRTSGMDEDTFVKSFFAFPTETGSDDTQHPMKRKVEEQNSNILSALNLDLVFSQEELQVIEEEVVEEEEPLGSPRKKRRANNSVDCESPRLEEEEEACYAALNEDDDLGELQSFEEQVHLRLFDVDF